MVRAVTTPDVAERDLRMAGGFAKALDRFYRPVHIPDSSTSSARSSSRRSGADHNLLVAEAPRPTLQGPNGPRPRQTVFQP